MGTQKQICFVCNDNESKYKCPKCLIRYCGLACYKTHKGGNSCEDEQAKKLALEQQESNKVYETSDAVQKCLEALDDEQILNRETLSRLWESPSIQAELNNKEIKEALMALNSSSKPDEDFLKLTNMKFFSDFMDKCFELIEMESKCLSYNVRPVIYVSLEPLGASETASGPHKSGFGYLDVSFSKCLGVDVSKIRFKNFYTHQIRILSRRIDPMKIPAVDESQWRTSVPWTTLMPDAHDHGCAEKRFSLLNGPDAEVIKDVTHLRFHLRQPSPMWKEFRIEDIQIEGHQADCAKPRLESLPAWFRELNDGGDDAEESDGSAKSVEDLSSRMQELMACITLAGRECQTIKETRRRKRAIDGCYDINVLSHSKI